MRIADTLWGYAWYGTPKARMLKQILMDLQKFGTFQLLDDKHGERPHIKSKQFVQRHANFAWQDNQDIMHQNGKEHILTYACNGGRWGPQMKYQLGDACIEMKDPMDDSKPHPFLVDFLLPTGIERQSPVQVTLMAAWPMGEDDPDDFWWNLLDDECVPHLCGLVYEKWGVSCQSAEDLLCNNHLKISVIHSWNYSDGLKSFKINVRAKNFKPSQLLLQNDDVIIGDLFVCIERNGECLCVLKGTVYPKHVNEHCDEWGDLGCASMHWIELDEGKDAWRLMDTIVESVQLFHDHVDPTHVRPHLPQAFHELSRTQWNLQILEMSKQWIDHDIPIHHRPCGVYWICTEHNRPYCARRVCSQHENKNDSRWWSLRWVCNHVVHDKFWIWESDNGYLPALGDDHNLKHITEIW